MTRPPRRRQTRSISRIASLKSAFLGVSLHLPPGLLERRDPRREDLLSASLRDPLQAAGQRLLQEAVVMGKAAHGLPEELPQVRVLRSA